VGRHPPTAPSRFQVSNLNSTWSFSLLPLYFSLSFSLRQILNYPLQKLNYPLQPIPHPHCHALPITILIQGLDAGPLGIPRVAAPLLTNPVSVLFAVGSSGALHSKPKAIELIGRILHGTFGLCMIRPNVAPLQGLIPRARTG